jgi:hypothetical protein
LELDLFIQLLLKNESILFYAARYVDVRNTTDSKLENLKEKKDFP